MKKTIVMLAILSGLVQAEDNYQAKFDDGWVTLNDLVLHKTSVSNNTYSDAGDITNGTLPGGNATMSWKGLTEDTDLTLSDSWRISFTLTNVTSGANPIFSTDTNGSGATGYILKVTAKNDNNEYFLQFGNETISDTALTMNTGYDITLSFIDLVDNKGVSQGGMFIVNVKGEDVYSTRIAATDLGNADFEGSTSNTVKDYSRLWTNGGYQQFSNVKIETNGRLIPEPTTTTLSLLALAGLAARRRRR